MEGRLPKMIIKIKNIPCLDPLSLLFSFKQWITVLSLSLSLSLLLSLASFRSWVTVIFLNNERRKKANESSYSWNFINQVLTSIFMITFEGGKNNLLFHLVNHNKVNKFNERSDWFIKLALRLWVWNIP